MALKTLRQLGMMLPLLISLLGWADGACAEDSAALMRAMSLLPLQYGGVVHGVVAGRILLALHEPDLDGTVQGEVLILAQGQDPAISGDVHGTWQPAEVPGGHDCTLQLPLGKQTLTLDGVCSASEVSGTLYTRPPQSGWIWRKLLWWDEADSEGRGWLTRSSFNDRTLPPNSY